MPKKKKSVSKQKVVKKGFVISPVGDKVVVRPIINDDTTTASGIIIPDSVSNKEKPERGVVMAVGKGRYEDGDLIPMTVKIGDTVLFSKYGFDSVKVEGTEYYILSESGILGVITK